MYVCVRVRVRVCVYTAACMPCAPTRVLLSPKMTRFFCPPGGQKNNFNLTPRAIELRVGRACTRSLVASKAFAYVRAYVYTWVQIVPYVCLYLYIYISARCVDSGAAADDE